MPVKITISPARFDVLQKRALLAGEPLAVYLRPYVDPAFREPKTPVPSPEP